MSTSHNHYFSAHNNIITSWIRITVECSRSTDNCRPPETGDTSGLSTSQPDEGAIYSKRIERAAPPADGGQAD